MRAYIRLDPEFPEHKAEYPDGPWRALVETFCYASHQPYPGTFKSEALLRVLLGKRARHIPFLVAHDDIVYLPDGRLYVEGWREWQEGKYADVKARVDAIRGRCKPVSGADRTALWRQRKRDATSQGVTDGDETRVTYGDETGVTKAAVTAESDRSSDSDISRNGGVTPPVTTKGKELLKEAMSRIPRAETA